MTTHQLHARSVFASIADQPESRWTPIASVEPGVWYDFCCPITGAYGQCRMGDDMAWTQEPRGERPVVLAYRKRRRKAGVS